MLDQEAGSRSKLPCVLVIQQIAGSLLRIPAPGSSMCWSALPGLHQAMKHASCLVLHTQAQCGMCCSSS